MSNFFASHSPEFMLMKLHIFSDDDVLDTSFIYIFISVKINKLHFLELVLYNNRKKDFGNNSRRSFININSRLVNYCLFPGTMTTTTKKHYFSLLVCSLYNGNCITSH